MRADECACVYLCDPTLTHSYIYTRIHTFIHKTHTQSETSRCVSLKITVRERHCYTDRQEAFNSSEPIIHTHRLKLTRMLSHKFREMIWAVGFVSRDWQEWREKGNLGKERCCDGDRLETESERVRAVWNWDHTAETQIHDYTLFLSNIYIIIIG